MRLVNQQEALVIGSCGLAPPHLWAIFPCQSVVSAYVFYDGFENPLGFTLCHVNRCEIVRTDEREKVAPSITTRLLFIFCARHIYYTFSYAPRNPTLIGFIW